MNYQVLQESSCMILKYMILKKNFKITVQCNDQASRHVLAAVCHLRIQWLTFLYPCTTESLILWQSCCSNGLSGNVKDMELLCNNLLVACIIYFIWIFNVQVYWSTISLQGKRPEERKKWCNSLSTSGCLCNDTWKANCKAPVLGYQQLAFVLPCEPLLEPKDKTYCKEGKGFYCPEEAQLLLKDIPANFQDQL